MSVSQSNLSAPAYTTYDLVVAVTQASVNAAMTRYLAKLQDPEMTICYVYDANSALVEIDYEALKKNANGSDPFSVAADADPKTNTDLINLANANFAGAFRTTLGLPNVSLIPPVVTLTDGTTAPVLFNLMFSEFQVTGFNYGPHTTWLNQSQPTGQGTPWYFSANVELNKTVIDPNSPVPPAVQARIQELEHIAGKGAFSIQQLFLDLDTAILESVPAIEGLPAGWPAWAMVNKIFLASYFAKLQKIGQPVLSYSFNMNAPAPASLQLGAISHECCGLQVGGKPISNPTAKQAAATTFVYVGTTTTTPPIAVPFSWNWVEEGDVSSYAGVQAVRRDIFLNFFANLVNQNIGALCQDTTVELTHSGDNYTIYYHSNSSPTPATFQLIAPVGQPGADGFIDVMSLAYVHNSHDDSEAADHFSSIHGDYNYNLTSTVAVHNNQLRIITQAIVYMEFNHHEVGIDYTDLPGANYCQKTQTITYTLGVDTKGALVVTADVPPLVDQSASWNFTAHGILGAFGAENDVKNGLNDVNNNISSFLSSAFGNFQTSLTNEINSYQGWVFPGADTFVLSNVAFSDSQDLSATLVYADTKMNSDIKAAATV